MKDLFRNIYILSFIVIMFFSSGIKQADGKTQEKALWVWNTSEIIEDSHEREEFLSFLSHEEFTCIFLQIPGDFDIKADEIHNFISDLSYRNIKVYGLDGNKDYVFPEKHDFVLETVDKIILYNEKSKENEKFYGIQYDIEPYLLPEFDTDKQAWILENYLELLKKISRKSHGNSLIFSVAIPFWFDDGDRFYITFDGEEKLLLQHIIDLADNIAIMSYRTEAGGDNGIVKLTALESFFSILTNKKYFIGLETKPLPDKNLTFASAGLNRLILVMDELTGYFRKDRAFAGFAIHEYRSYKKLVNESSDR